MWSSPITQSPPTPPTLLRLIFSRPTHDTCNSFPCSSFGPVSSFCPSYSSLAAFLVCQQPLKTRRDGARGSHRLGAAALPPHTLLRKVCPIMARRMRCLLSGFFPYEAATHLPYLFTLFIALKWNIFLDRTPQFPKWDWMETPTSRWPGLGEL